MKTDTPPHIDEVVLELCKRVCPGIKPVYVPCLPEQYSVRDDCFFNVDEKIRREGGEKVHGWQIWLWPSVLIEAEFHAVWKSPHHDLIDITPKDIPTSRILFLPDSIRVYADEDIDNVRMALTDSQLVKDFISLCKARSLLIARGRVKGTKEVRLDQDEYVSLNQAIALNLHMIDNNYSRNTPCPCGSKEKYKRCHEPMFDKIRRYYGVAS